MIRQVGNILIPYDNRKLAELTKMDFDTVTVAMELLKQIGLVEILENGEIYITQLENLIGSISKGAFKKQMQLARRNQENELGWTEGGIFSTKDKDKDKDKNIRKENILKEKKFEKPTLEELENYKLERKSSLDIQKFYNYYEANGWKVGKNPMKDWKATFRYWERNENPKQNEQDLPSWYGKEIKKQTITTEEQKELEEMLKDFEE